MSRGQPPSACFLPRHGPFAARLTHLHPPTLLSPHTPPPPVPSITFRFPTTSKHPQGLPVVQWLRLWASTTGGTGLIHGWETMGPHATWHGQHTPINRKHTLGPLPHFQAKGMGLLKTP